MTTSFRKTRKTATIDPSSILETNRDSWTRSTSPSARTMSNVTTPKSDTKTTGAVSAAASAKMMKVILLFQPVGRANRTATEAKAGTAHRELLRARWDARDSTQSAPEQ